MQTNINNNINANTITLHIGEYLDLNILSSFNQICKLATCTEMQKIILDLRRTYYIFDSGLAMLLMLSKQTENLNVKIILINCRPEISSRISTYNIPPPLQVN